jgi:hypothetical protein
MVDKILRICVVGFVLILAFSVSVPAQENKAEGEKIARIESQGADQAASKAFSGEPSVPQWLDNLLTRVPEEPDVKSSESGSEQHLQQNGSADAIGPEPESPQAGETDKLSEELQQGLTESAKKPGEAPDPVFPKPAAIAPLYLSPQLQGEGVWTAEGLPVGVDGHPLFYKTAYRPSLEYPNSMVYMAIFDMSRISPRFFVGQTEPGIYQISHASEREDLSRIVAITNAMWMQQHARGAGAIFRGQVVYPMVNGMATLVIYQDDSVDILEWSNEIPVSMVKDARQLRHLIVKDGMVVEKVAKQGRVEDAEIGLGGFLIDDRGRSTMANKDVWFLANRTAFGIRDDGNLVFAMAHHTGTKDLARALVLAGCKRAIHGDANIHNIVCNFYFRDEANKIVKRDKLSPEQLNYTMKRYDQGYSKDFFAFYEK